MKIKAKVRFGSSRQNVEGFGNDRYLVNIISKIEEADASSELLHLLSKQLGLPVDKIEIVNIEKSSFNPSLRDVTLEVL